MKSLNAPPPRNLNDDAEPWGRHIDSELRDIKRVVERLTGETRGVRRVVAAAADNADAKIKEQEVETGVVKDHVEGVKQTAEEALDDALSALQYAEDAMAAAKDAWKQVGNRAANWSFEDGQDFWGFVPNGSNTWGVIDSATAYEGNKVARLALVPLTGAVLHAAVSTAPRAETGVIWRSTFRVRATGSSIMVTSGFRTFNETLSVFAEEWGDVSSIPADGEWHSVTYTFEVPVEHLSRITPALTATPISAAALEVDAVLFEDITEATLAQRKADAAQAAAGAALLEAQEAKADAAGAQGTADQAVADAAAANTNATNAQNAADLADSVAQAAQSAAAAAQAEADAAREEFANLDIGARNLVRETSYVHSNEYEVVTDTGDVLFTGQPIYHGIKLSSATPNTNLKTLEALPGETYTASIWVKYDDSTPSYPRILWYSTAILVASQEGAVAGEWRRLEATWTNESSEPITIRAYFYLKTTEGTETWFSSPKVERGNKATDWSPAPEDLEAKAQAAQAAADAAAANAATAQSAADAAQSRADQAHADAAAAQAAADAAQSSADGAQLTADEAITNAATAQTKADQAHTNAASAQTAADNAAQAAIDAAGLAGDAQAAADAAAQDAIDKANAAEAAAKSYAEAQANAAEAAAIAAALIDATEKADSAEDAAKAHADAQAAAAEAAATAAAALDAKNKADAAQAAAEAKAEEARLLASGKADVLIQSTAPAVAMRKSTTLWIDTTSGANTPKRWDGSEWVVVTDKAATDAAQAAVNAHNAANAAQDAADAAQTAADEARDLAEDAMGAAADAQIDATIALQEARAKIKAGSNIIINGGFEEGLLGWENMEGRGEVTDTKSRSGSYSLSVAPYPTLIPVLVDPGSAPRSRWYDLPPGVRVVRLESYYTADTSDLISVVGPVFLNSAGEVTLESTGEYSNDIDSSGDWTRHTYTMTLPEDIVSVAFMCVWVGTGGNGYIDDVSLIDMTEADLVGKEAALGIENATAEITAAYSAEITQHSDNIMSTVTAEYTAKTELAEEIGLVQSQIQQTVENIDFRFIEVTDSIINVGNDLTTYQSEVANYIRFSSAGIELGETGSPFVAQLSNTELAFLEGGRKIAYISNNQMHITNAEIRYNLSLGTPESGFFDWIPRTNGNLSLVHRSE